MRRNRTCNEPEEGGKPCPEGDDEEIDVCDTGKVCESKSEPVVDLSIVLIVKPVSMCLSVCLSAETTRAAKVSGRVSLR